MEPTDALDPRDLRSLLMAPATELLGRIMALNHGPKYHNALDAIAIACRIEELRADGSRALGAIPLRRPDRPLRRRGPDDTSVRR